MQDTLSFIYNVMLVLGILIPLANLILGGLGDVLNMDFDVDGNSGFDAPLPINISCLFFSFAIMGLVGGRFNHVISLLGSFLIALVCSVVGYILLYRFVIRPLKRNDASAMRIKDMRGAVGTVTIAIPYAGKGEARFTDRQGSSITYLVRYNHTDFPMYDTIAVGSSVSVVGIEGDTLVVCIAPSQTSG